MQEKNEIKNEKVVSYKFSHLEDHRPPSRGGTTNDNYLHILTINKKDYTFIAIGQRKWVFKHDTVSFEYHERQGRREISKNTLKALDKNGNEVVRGDRGVKNKWRKKLYR